MQAACASARTPTCRRRPDFAKLQSCSAFFASKTAELRTPYREEGREDVRVISIVMRADNINWAVSDVDSDDALDCAGQARHAQNSGIAVAWRDKLQFTLQ